MFKAIGNKAGLGKLTKKSKKQLQAESRSMTQLKVRVEGLVKCFGKWIILINKLI